MFLKIMTASTLLLIVSCSSIQTSRLEDIPKDWRLSLADGSDEYKTIRKPAEVAFSNVSIGEVKMTSTNGAVTISGPNGAIILSAPNRDTIEGSWSKGIEVNINQVLSKGQFPSVININQFDMALGDKRTASILAVTPQEDAMESNARYRVIFRRAQKICDLTGYKYIHEIRTKDQWFPDILIDLSESVKTTDGENFKAYNASAFSGARYFNKIICSKNPTGYYQ